MSSQKYISDTLKRRKQKKSKIKLYIIVFLIILFVWGLMYVSRLPKFKITDVQISGLGFLNEEDIRKTIDDQLNQHILWLIPKSNIFLFSKKELIHNLSENPAIISVKINKKFLNTIFIKIEEQSKQAIYCVNDAHTECYYVNHEGMVYGFIKDYVIPEQEIIFYIPNKKIEIKNTIIETDLYKTIFNFIKSVNQLEIKVRQVHIYEDGVIEFKTQSGVTLKTSIFDNFEKDFLNLTALFEKELLKLDTLGDIEYIDLRFGNKVFYKNKTN